MVFVALCLCLGHCFFIAFVKVDSGMLSYVSSGSHHAFLLSFLVCSFLWSLPFWLIFLFKVTLGLVLFIIQHNSFSVLQPWVVCFLGPASSSAITHPPWQWCDEQRWKWRRRKRKCSPFVWNTCGNVQRLSRHDVRGTVSSPPLPFLFLTCFLGLIVAKCTCDETSGQVQHPTSVQPAGGEHSPPLKHFQRAFRQADNQPSSRPHLQNYQLLGAEGLTCC